MYKRVLLKFSGEALRDFKQHLTFDVKHVDEVTNMIKTLHDSGVEIAIIIGAGNIWRGKLAKEFNMDGVEADYSGMLGTVINSITLASNLRGKGVPAIVYSAISPIDGVTFPYVEEQVKEDLANKKVVFIAGGTGKPGFTTDTAATMRALELDCEAIFMGKNGVEGVYTADPRRDPNAQFIKSITYQEMIDKNLNVMDKSAVELIMNSNSNIEIRVFSMSDSENFLRVVNGEDIGTTVKKGE